MDYWRGGRFSQVLQVPVHPICEGLFLEAGVQDSEIIAVCDAGMTL